MNRPARRVADLSPTLSSRLQWLWPLALAGTLVLASGNNPAPVPGAFVGFDKLAHFCLFGLLATLILRVDTVWRRPGWRGWLAILAVSAFGATDEWHQFYTPGRSVEFGDWLADTTGPMLAVTLYLQWGWYRRLLETPLGLRRRKTDRAASETAPRATVSGGLG